MKIFVFNAPNVNILTYQEATELVKNCLNLEFIFSPVPDQTEYVQYQSGFYGIDFQTIAKLSTSSYPPIQQFIHIPKRDHVVSFACMNPINGVYFSQVNGTGEAHYNILHELSHSIHAYLHSPDRTHEFLIPNARFKELYQTFVPYRSFLEGDPECAALSFAYQSTHLLGRF